MSELIDKAVLIAKMYSEAFESDTDLQRWDSGCWIRYKLFEKVVDSTPTVPYGPRWHRVEEPPQIGQECFTAYRSILRSDPEWLYDICYYTDDLARDCPLMYGAEHRPGWYRYESEYGDVECHPKYWMPIEPPEEDA